MEKAQNRHTFIGKKVHVTRSFFRILEESKLSDLRNDLRYKACDFEFSVSDCVTGCESISKFLGPVQSCVGNYLFKVRH